MTDRRTYLLVDGENIDATLGGSILGRRPRPEERPRWNQPLAFMQRTWGQSTRGLFFLAVDGEIPVPFVQALTTLGYQPIMLSGEGKVVDIAIQRTAEALVDRSDDVVLLSHDRDFAPQLARLREDAQRRVGLMGFREFLSSELRALEGVEFFDLEHDVEAFTIELPRLRVIAIEEFDPLEFL
ncbi:NYN domain-containing protein [Brachybacterium sp. EF45031]|uniref:NYN domain-containing protein n=1 Tax=Brachybacterium sillae TaxID=2810536 RepID=UPI00217E6469|nr:NYN domain-containing protein [Brachybacterium sillae]MCS6711550.1 NYN domain-containing protein [Brachybacterium sillae]